MMNTIRIDGIFTIDDFNEQFRVDLPDEDYPRSAARVGARPPGQPGDVVEA